MVPLSMLRGTYNPVVEGLSLVQYLLMGLRLGGLSRVSMVQHHKSVQFQLPQEPLLSVFALHENFAVMLLFFCCPDLKVRGCYC
jgi:hypothetical protein